MPGTEESYEQLQPAVGLDDEFDPLEAGADGNSPVLDDADRRIENAELDNVLDEFIEVVNSRDMDGLTELLAPDAEAMFLDEYSRDGVVSGFHDLLMRNPTTVLSRADYGTDPIAALWTYDREADGFDPFGYFMFELSDTQTGLIQRVEYVEAVDDPDDLVVETPENSELPEWWDWSAYDED